MEKRQIGNTSLQVTELSFGGSSIGNLYSPMPDEQAQQVIHHCWDLGVRYFDTAPEYGHGLSERRMGDALRAYSQNEYVLSTKVGEILYCKHQQLPPENKFIDKLPFHLKYDYSYDGVMRAFEDSLQRLGLNSLDIILVHDLDKIIHMPGQFDLFFKKYIDGGYKALAELRSQGIIKAIGLGVKQWQVCDAALKYGDYDCFMLERSCNLLEQSAVSTLFPICQQKNISVLIAGPFASGILATGAVSGAYFHHRAAEPRILERVQKIQTICDDFNVPLAAAAIQFPLKHPVVSSVVIGSRSIHEMQQNFEYYGIVIPEAFWETLLDEAIIPEIVL